MSFPSPVSGRVSEETKAQIEQATERFGPSESTIVRMALESFLPGFLTAQGRPENVEFFAELSEAINQRDPLREEITAFVRQKMRSQIRSPRQREAAV